MIYLLTGALSFALFVFFDVKKAQGERTAVFWFAAGALLLIASTGMLLAPAFTGERAPWRNVFGVIAIAWFAIYLYVLFGALPAKQAYGDKRLSVVKSGPYALCRHPGGWCFLFLYGSLYLFSGGTEMLFGAILFPALNFLYIWIEDTYLFPKHIAGYGDYKREVPFLLPNRHSIGAFFKKP